jgi:phosphoglycolate phosphatase
MSYKAVIFDLDGTMLDTIRDIANPVNIVLQRYNFPTHDLTTFRDLIGNGIGQLVYRALPAEVAESTSYSTILNEVWTEYQQHLNKSTVPYDGIYELLNKLSNKGIILNILSNKADEFMDEVVGKYFSNWDFKLVFGARHGVPLKPDPYSAFEIINELDIGAGECIFIGDSDVDMQTANHAGIYAVGASWGFRSKSELLAHGADIVIDHPLELLRLFD